MIRRWTRLSRRPRRVLFVCSASVDESWIRTTALACASEGLVARLAICGNADSVIVARYAQAGLGVDFISSLMTVAAIDSDLVVTASSGLERAILGSRNCLFVHMPHSLASLHMIYPADAFDGYDVLFAAGPHHQVEWERLSTMRRGRTRPCMNIGYGKLDVLRELPSRRIDEVPHILLAPSWGPDNLLERMGPELVLGMLKRGWRVTVRPHPLFMIENAPVVDELRTLAMTLPRCELENPLVGDGALGFADLLVGDYSGTAFEFCALRERPVVSVNVGLKEVNAEWRSLGLAPVELALREQLGASVVPEPSVVIDTVARLLEDREAGARAAVCAPKFIYAHREHCGRRAAHALRELAIA